MWAIDDVDDERNEVSASYPHRHTQFVRRGMAGRETYGVDDESAKRRGTPSAVPR